MKIKLSFLLMLYACLQMTTSKSGDLQLVILNTTTALCLDGSPGAYYVSKEGDAQNIFIQFQGGGWCADKDLISTYQNCYGRSKTDLGSSKQYHKNIYSAEGVFSVNSQNNFKNWKKVLLTYCDGSGHQGTRKQPIQYKNTSLYFRGHNITVQQLDSLEQKIGLFSKAKQVVVSGASAGGLAVYHWTNYIVQRVKNGKVWSLPDSGIFLDSYNVIQKQPSYKLSFFNLMKISNIEIDPPCPQCIKQFPQAKQNCMFAQNLYKHITIPLFPIQSLYDTWSIYNVLGVTCIGGGQSMSKCNSTQRQYIQQYKYNVTLVLNDITSSQRNGCWAPACANHVYSRGSAYYDVSFRIPQHSENSVARSVQSWLENKAVSYKHMDSQAWPCNKPCSGLPKQYKGMSEQ